MFIFEVRSLMNVYFIYRITSCWSRNNQLLFVKVTSKTYKGTDIYFIFLDNRFSPKSIRTESNVVSGLGQVIKAKEKVINYISRMKIRKQVRISANHKAEYNLLNF